MPSYELYWTTDSLLELRGLKKIMPRNWFELMMQFLHLSDNSTDLPRDHPDHDRLHKIRPLLEHLVERWKAAYHPDREVSVDESIIAFKGRSSMVVYKPNKPHKWGLNMWVLAEAKSGYAYNMELYTGKAGHTEVGLTKNVVVSLCRPLFQTGHHVYMDNYFSSPALFCALKDQQLGACGTLRVNRIGVPEAIKKAKLKKDSHSVVERDDDGILYIAWFDRRQVTVMSSIHSSATFMATVRSRTAPDHQRIVEKPMAIQLYTKYMQGVDRADQLLWYKISLHRQQKWWKKVFMYLLEVSCVNSTIIFRALHPDRRIDSTKCRLAIIHALLEKYPQQPPSRLCRRPSIPPSRLTERHFLKLNTKLTPAGRPVSPDCEVCSKRGVKRHQTQMMCRQCDIPMCAYPCFERFHTLVDYKIDCTDNYHKE